MTLMCSAMDTEMYTNFNIYPNCSANTEETVHESSLIDNHAFGKYHLDVQCLKSLEGLKERCDDFKKIFSDNVSSGSSYEVDIIFAHKLIKDEMHYYVKWKNSTSDSNTWEPECRLAGCEETINYYHAMKSSKSHLDRKILHYFVGDLTTRKPYDTLSLTKTCALCFDSSEKYIDSLQLTVSQMKQKVQEILTFSNSRLGRIYKKLFSIMQFAEDRKLVLINLKEWEMEINKLNQSSRILVENNVDLEMAPASFQFIHDNIYTSVKIPEEPVAFCHCENCYNNKQSCCPKDSEGHFAYSRHRRLMLQPGWPIYECNKYCKCTSDCVNRVVQHGQKVKVCIFRTSNCGWGLKALEPIEKDQFVLEYLGEIITSEAAEARGHIYDYIGRSYLFDLDYGVESCQFTIDAGLVGNAAHFINHSCDPNMHVFAVWINQPDPRLPRLAFFAKRKIKRGEELTFDYKMVQRDRFGVLESDSPDSQRILCRCGSKNCRKYLF